MKMEKFTEKYLAGYKDLPPAWKTEVLLILAGEERQHSAKLRGVTPDAVKAQRKKIFRALKVQDGKTLLFNLFHVAVSNLK